MKKFIRKCREASDLASFVNVRIGPLRLLEIRKITKAYVYELLQSD